jgi:hypothetical protein
MSVAVGSFLWDTGAIGTIYGASGLGFRPAAVFLSWSGKTQAGSDAVPTRHSLTAGEGFLLENGKRGCVTRYCQDNADPYQAGGGMWESWCAVRQTDSGTAVGKLDFSAMTEDGFECVVDEAVTTGFTVFFMAVSGVEFNVVDVTEPGATGVVAYTGAGFRPTFARFYSAGKTTIDAVAGNIDEMFGAASDSAEDRQCVIALNDMNALGYSQTNSYCRHGQCVAFTNNDDASAAVNCRASLNGFTDDGFELNWLERSSTRRIKAVVASGRWYVFTDHTRNAAGAPWSDTGMTWSPEGLIVVSRIRGGTAAQNDESADDACEANSNNGSAIGHGYGIGPTSRLVQYHGSGGGRGTGVNIAWSWHRVDEVLLDSDGGSSYDVALGMIDINSAFTSDTVELVQDDADPNNDSFFMLIAIGPPVIAFRQRLVRYQHNSYQSRDAGRTLIRDVLGRTLPNHDVKPDNFLFAGGPSFITPTKFSSLIVNPATFYLESVQPTEDRVKIETNRESLIQSLFRRLGS